MGLDITVHKFTSEKTERFITLSNRDSWENTPVKHLITKKTQRYFDLEKILKKKGYSPEECHCYVMSCDGWGFDVIKTGERIFITYEEALSTAYDYEDDILYYEEIGYQRKGLNDKFYEDYRNGKISYWVWTKAELERYLQEYVEPDMKEHFQEYIINPFVEGFCGVSFDW